MTKDKGFYKQFFKICIVLVLQNMLTLSVNLADNVMLGNYNEMALAGATAVNQVQFVYQQLLLGLGDALVILGSQYWGRREVEEVKKTGAVAMVFGIVLTALFFANATFNPEFLMHIFTTDTAIIEQGIAYLSIIRFTYIFLGIVGIILAILRTVEVVKIAFALSLSTLLINCSINWVLIYGRYGFPELGIQGAAIGTLIARMIELVILILYIATREKQLRLRVCDFLRIERDVVKQYSILLWPILLGGVTWGLNTALQTAILGHMSSNAITANSVSSNLSLLIKTGAVGAATTSSIIIGKKIGEGRLELVQVYAKKLQIMFASIGVVSSCILYLLIEPVLSLYTLSPESRDLAEDFLKILCIIVVFMAYQMPTNIGLIRGAGGTKYMMYLDLISIYLIVLPLSFFMAFVVEASPVVVVLCLNVDQLFKGIPAFIKVNYGKWIHVLTI